MKNRLPRTSRVRKLIPLLRAQRFASPAVEEEITRKLARGPIKQGWPEREDAERRMKLRVVLSYDTCPQFGPFSGETYQAIGYKNKEEGLFLQEGDTITPISLADACAWLADWETATIAEGFEGDEDHDPKAVVRFYRELTAALPGA